VYAPVVARRETGRRMITVIPSEVKPLEFSGWTAQNDNGNMMVR
jgi:hypothetical protein